MTTNIEFARRVRQVLTNAGGRMPIKALRAALGESVDVSESALGRVGGVDFTASQVWLLPPKRWGPRRR